MNQRTIRENKEVPSSNSIRVLYIEDNLGDLYLIKTMLSEIKSIDYHVVHTQTLISALAILNGNEINAILLDLSLPDTSGLDGFIQLNERFSDIPIIVLTGLDDEEVAISAVKKGAQDYLIKGSVNHNILSNSIRYAIERKIAEKIRFELENRRSRFVGMVSHELRTPLSVIRGYMDFIEKFCTDTPNARILSCLPPIKRNIIRLENLVENVNDISKIENKMFKMNIEEINVKSFFETVTKPSRDFFLDQIILESCPLTTVNNFEGDSKRIEQVIDNLLANAIKQTPDDKRRIKIKYQLLPEKLTVSISDNGAGIAPENLDRIFKQFVSIPTSYNTGGSGIGLYISRKIIVAHGGSLIAQSGGEEKGSIFLFEIPRTQEQSSSFERNEGEWSITVCEDNT